MENITSAIRYYTTEAQQKTDLMENLTSTIRSYTTEPQQKTQITAVLLLQILVLIPLIILGNTLILAAIKYQKSLHKITYYLLGNLAVADLLFGLNMVVRVALIIANKFNALYCLITTFIAILAGGGSLSGLLFICIQNFIAVKFVFSARNGLSAKKASVLVVGG